jgi:hypothetical protein
MMLHLFAVRSKIQRIKRRIRFFARLEVKKVDGSLLYHKTNGIISDVLLEHLAA